MSERSLSVADGVGSPLLVTLAVLLVLWLGAKAAFVHAVTPARNADRLPRAKGQMLAALVPPGRTLYLFQLKDEGIGIFLISHDIHDVFDLADRLCVMKNGRVVGTARTGEVTKDEVLGMIILGKCPPGATPGPGAMTLAA